MFILAVSGGKIKAVKCLTENITAYELLEFEIAVECTAGNGFDPDELRLEISFAGSDGTVRKHPCFLYGYCNKNADGRYSLKDGMPFVWRARIAPDKPGNYRAEFMLYEKNIRTDIASAEFIVKDGNEKRGFIRVEPTVKKAFMFENGEIFTPLGQNVCWCEKVDWKNRRSPETLDMYKRIFGKMHKYKANWSRLWLSAEWDFGFFGKTDKTYDFSAALVRAARLDDLIEIMRENDIYSVMVFYHHGMFNIGGANTDWSNNAFNAENPYGYLKAPADFFTDPRCTKEAKQYITYMIARYGYSRNIFSWELFNEVNFTDGDPDAVYDWHRIMTEHIRKTDAHPHMVTTSSSVNRYPLIFDNMFDYINMHRYGDPGNPKMIAHEAYLSFHDFDRPIMMEESGYDAYRPFTNHIARHTQIWAGLMANTPATAMEWFWDSWDEYTNGTADPDYSYRAFAPAADFAALIPRADKKQRFVSRERLAMNNPDADVIGYNGADYAYLWIYSLRYTPPSETEKKISGVRMELWLENGDYAVRWYDTYSGVFFKEENITVRGSFLCINAPEFTKDIALEIKKKK